MWRWCGVASEAHLSTSHLVMWAPLDTPDTTQHHTQTFTLSTNCQPIWPIYSILESFPSSVFTCFKMEVKSDVTFPPPATTQSQPSQSTQDSSQGSSQAHLTSYNPASESSLTSQKPASAPGRRKQAKPQKKPGKTTCSQSALIWFLFCYSSLEDITSKVSSEQ